MKPKKFIYKYYRQIPAAHHSPPLLTNGDQQSAHCYCGSPKFLVHCPSDIRILGEFFSPNLRKRGFSQMLS